MVSTRTRAAVAAISKFILAAKYKDNPCFVVCVVSDDQGNPRSLRLDDLESLLELATLGMAVLGSSAAPIPEHEYR